MPNPGGNYPGRQIFLGRAKTGQPAFAYFGSGRSTGSQSRYATRFIEGESAVRIRPTNPAEKFDPFRHYQAVRIDPETGLLVVSNSQAPMDAVFEAYKFMPDEEKLSYFSDFLRDLLRVIGPEYDSREKPTPRIVGVVSPTDSECVEILGITAQRGSAFTVRCYPQLPDGTLLYVQTYNGDVDYDRMDIVPLGHLRTLFKTDAETAEQLANEIFDISDYVDPKYGELRVWCVAGIKNGKGPGGWELARRNRHGVATER